MRQKSAIYTPKRDDGHPRHFHMGVPPPIPPPGVALTFKVISSNSYEVVYISFFYEEMRVFFYLNVSLKEMGVSVFIFQTKTEGKESA